jgi:hypothetical protein
MRNLVQLWQRWINKILTDSEFFYTSEVFYICDMKTVPIIWRTISLYFMPLTEIENFWSKKCYYHGENISYDNTSQN